MKLENIEPFGLPVAFTDGLLLQLFIFMTATVILSAQGGVREVDLQLPEVDARGTRERQFSATGALPAIEIGILRTGRLTVAGKELAAVNELGGMFVPGQPIVIALEKGAAADVLLALEVELKRLGVREVSVLVKGG